ncbi:MAG TPA: DUF192 domain-containing protein [archaeon]|jgi:uncharacterized membrane protein (UPF0127 family)|nr:DUF192 domain-containing protein [archaeon]
MKASADAFCLTIEKAFDMKILKGRTVIAENVEVAEGFFHKMRGLMLRGSLPRSSALLMVFGNPGKHGIWMPLMRFPIDIVFLDSRKRVVGLHERARPVSFRRRTWKVYYPERDAKYAMEMAAGTIRKTGIKDEDRFTFLS